MDVIETPYFTLMTKFITPNSVGKTNNAGNYLDYINREEAKENIQLNKDSENFEGYFDYMKRDNAKKMKQKISDKDLAKLEISSDIQLNNLLANMKSEPSKVEFLKTGMFDYCNNDLSRKEVLTYKKEFTKSQKRGNILYQDVISFDTKGLIEAGIYNPYNGFLDREPLIKASRKMINQMIKSENLDPKTMFVGQIHYNTEHFHIHYATMEKSSNRSLINFNDEVQQKGKRKQSTLDSMKSVFVNQIFDRTEQLQQLSDLRNSMRYSIKNEMNQQIKTNLLLQKEFKDLKKSLPKNSRDLNMSSLNPQATQKMYKFIDKVMKNSDEFKTYVDLAKQEDEFKRRIYGTLPDGQKSFFEGRMYGKDGIYYRLGNSILEEIKLSNKEDIQYNQTNNVNNIMPKNVASNYNKMYFNMKQMNKFLNNYMSKETYKAKMEYERMQRESEYGDYGFE